MSRVRFGYALACLGILITTGGCAGSATAPEAATAERAVASEKKDTAPAPAPAPAPDEETEVTVQSGYLEGGGRY
jgi:hypothetical protein